VKYSNEIKVGLTIIVAAVIFILGIRYFEDLPLFDSTYDLVAEFDDAGGLIGGNIVRVNGVSVGSVTSVYISETTGKVIVEFHVDPKIPVTEGSYATVGGFDALGVVRIDLTLGPSSSPRIPEGGLVASSTSSDLMADMSARAPVMLDSVGRVLEELDDVLVEANTILSAPESDLRQTLAAARGSMSQVEALLAGERDRMVRILANADSLTADLDTAMGEDGEALTSLMAQMETTLATLNEDLERFQATNEQIDRLLQKLNEGEGTLGMLINDPSMYHRMDSTLNGLNALIVDFQANPGRYLKEMKFIDLF
jgi:phospholipid/cholesterol/gamma-HCH transport system substrate-binding protein